MKKPLLFMLALGAACSLQAQDPQDVLVDYALHDPYAIKDSMLSQLDKSSITTGLLLDKSIPFIKIRQYNGQEDSEVLINSRAWNKMYKI